VTPSHVLRLKLTEVNTPTCATEPTPSLWVQLGVTQSVPTLAGAHLPAPSQPAVHPVELAGHRGSGPLATALQVPAPLRLHRLQVEQDEVLQQTPSTQEPLMHSVGVEQAWPSERPTQVLLALQTGLLGLQSPLLQQLGNAARMQALPHTV
jgi:hypothetical protein